LLIANRGEIAVRVMRTARRLGVRTIAVYSEADVGAMHVAEADEAVCIGPPAPVESYLNIDAVLRAATESGAQAIHPGYGFLSENAAFAEACLDAGIIFVGPSAEAIRAMGDKAAAKAAMERADVPLVPGYHDDGQSPKKLVGAAKKIGFPVLIKASAGGGGRIERNT
jgi:3-methylcrotonyl-CoA carboxylase alpha subunit